jgi:cold shock CspA family protein/ribosome-associated translation inhibitor RaiA
MQVPLEISFHHIDRSEWAEEQIRARVAKLEKIYHRLHSCRVRIERRAKSSTQSTPPVVRIELGIPGYRELVVTHEPDYLRHKFQAPDLRNAIHAAFRVAEDQLAQLKAVRQNRSKQVLHDTENQRLGQVAEVNADADFGFILTEGGGLLHFHRDNLLSGDFDTLERGTAVYYVEGVGDTGPTATKVRVKNHG